MSGRQTSAWVICKLSNTRKNLEKRGFGRRIWEELSKECVYSSKGSSPLLLGWALIPVVALEIVHAWDGGWVHFPDRSVNSELLVWERKTPHSSSLNPPTLQ